MNIKVYLLRRHSRNIAQQPSKGVCVCVCVTFLPPGEQVSGGGVLVMFRGLEPQLEGEEPRILIEGGRWLQ